MELSPDLRALQFRIERLERQSRWQRRILIGLGAVLLAFVSEGRAPQAAAPVGRPAESRVLDGDKLILRAPDGSVRALWTAEPDGAQRLHFKDRQGKTRLALGLAPDGRPGVFLNDQAEAPRIGMFVGGSGTPSLALRNAAGTVRAALGLFTNGMAGLVFRDEQSNLRAQLAARADGQPGLNLYDKQGRNLFQAP